MWQCSRNLTPTPILLTANKEGIRIYGIIITLSQYHTLIFQKGTLEHFRLFNPAPRRRHVTKPAGARLYEHDAGPDR